MTIEFHCPHCDKLLKTPDDKAGVRANCPGCGQSVTIPDPAHETAQADPSFAMVPEVAGASLSVPAAPQAEGGQVIEAGFQDETVRQDDTGLQNDTDLKNDSRPCPMCGATIKQAATRCRYCGETLVRTGASERVPTKIDAGEILSHGWEIYKGQVGLLLGVVVVFYGIIFGAAFAGSLIQNLILFSVAGPAGRGGNPIAMGIAVFGLTLFFQVLNVALGAYLQAGLHVLLLRVARGENAEFVDLFSGMRFFSRFFWGTLLFQIMIGLGFLFLIIPGIILALMFWPLFYVIVDRDTGVIESLRLAHELTTGNYLAAFVLFLAGMGIQLLGVFPGMCVGWLFTSGLWMVLWAVAYCGMNGQLPLQHK